MTNKLSPRGTKWPWHKASNHDCPWAIGGSQCRCPEPEVEARAMTINEALTNARTLLESLGYTSGDIHDDLDAARLRLAVKYPKISEEEL